MKCIAATIRAGSGPPATVAASRARRRPSHVRDRAAHPVFAAGCEYARPPSRVRPTGLRSVSSHVRRRAIHSHRDRPRQRSPPAGVDHSRRQAGQPKHVQAEPGYERVAAERSAARRRLAVDGDATRMPRDRAVMSSTRSRDPELGPRRSASPAIPKYAGDLLGTRPTMLRTGVPADVVARPGVGSARRPVPRPASRLLAPPARSAASPGCRSSQVSTGTLGDRAAGR